MLPRQFWFPLFAVVMLAVPMSTLVPLLAHARHGVVTFSYLQAAIHFGYAVGGALAHRPLSPRRALLITVACGVGQACSPAVPSFLWELPMLMLTALAVKYLWVAAKKRTLEAVPPTMHGRAVSVFILVSSGSAAVGAVLASWLATTWPPDSLMVAGGAAVILAGGGALLIRRLRSE